jgi:PRC-barrel domain protein
MLKSMRKFLDFALDATDGEIGSLDEFYFDDVGWQVRYMVLKPRKWLSGRKVLISPVSLGKPDFQKRVFPANLSKEQIEASPAVKENKPLTRQDEERLDSYYQWPEYWKEMEKSRLHASKNVMGYTISAKDGDIGKVDDFVVDDDTWRIRYLVIDTGLLGKKVPIAPEWISEIDVKAKKILVGLLKDEIKKAPDYVTDGLTREYESMLYGTFGRRGYW